MKILILVLVCFASLQSVNCWSGNVCSTRVCRYVRRLVCTYRTWTGACCSWAWRTVPDYYNIYYCCSGWTHNGNEVCTIPICNPPCTANQGRCTNPNTCTCNPGFQGPTCNGLEQCSHTSPCYPGTCYGSGCVCKYGFDGSQCLQMQNNSLVPAINNVTATFIYHSVAKGMDISMYYGYAIDEDDSIWSNQDGFNKYKLRIEAIYDTLFDEIRQLPDLPRYVSGAKIGIVSVGVTIRHYKLEPGGGERLSQERNATCPSYSSLSSTNPLVNTLLNCSINDDSTYDTRIDSGDRIVLTTTVKSGGYVTLKNYVTNITTGTKLYTGEMAAVKNMILRYDYEPPKHCKESGTPPCSGNGYPLYLAEDITKNSIKASWDGWSDSLSGLRRYSFEVWKMEYSLDNRNLREPLITSSVNPVPEFIVEFNATGADYFQEYTPKGPGIYSCILEAADFANNSRYARRIVLYDSTSQITTTDDDIFCETASEQSDFKWQTNISSTTFVRIKWKNHFINREHADGHFLSSIADYQPRLTDGNRRDNYKKIDQIFDDNEGNRNRSEIDNVNGIVKFEFAYQVPQNGFSNVAWTELESLDQERDVPLLNIRDGDARQFWIRATDIMGNQKVDSTTVYFDASGPSISQPNIEYNIQNGRYPFSSRFSLVSKDSHSGIPLVTVKIVSNSGVVKYTHQYTDLLVSESACSSVADCYCTNADPGKCYMATMQLDIDNCWMQVPINATITDKHTLEISAYNGAMLSAMKSIEISDVKTLHGIQEYYTVTNLVIESINDKGFVAKWTQPRSCYPRFGILMTIMNNNNGRNTSYQIFKNVETYLVGNLDASTKYTIFMVTKYGDDDYFEMSQAVVTEVTTAQKPQGQEGGIPAGGIAGIVVGFLLLVIIFIIILFVLHRTGRLQKTKEQVTEKFSNLRQTVKSRDPSEKNFKNNRAVSTASLDDIYLYGGMQFKPEHTLPRSAFSFESEICRGRFAIIYKVLYYSNKNEAETLVAKTLKDQVSEDEVMKMRAKINFYATKVGHHRNIVDFKGEVDDEVRGPFMVLEYCETGSLKDYLKTNKNLVNEDMQERMFRFAYGICMGMNYLASKGIVHRRLAARNVLLDFLLEPKITGFGPDPTADDDSDNTSERIPVKWMAPECMTSTKNATERSDVWSFGIVLWEIFSMGETPYPDVRSQDLLNWVRQKRIMSKPEYCDDSFYRVMRKCWQYESKKRPNFEKLAKDLSEMFSEGPGDEYYYRSSKIYDNRV